MKAMKELREDDTRMVLTADKGVALVVMNKEDYIKKAEDLLNQPTYKLIPADPTNRQKTKLLNYWRISRQKGESMKKLTKECILQGQGPQNSMPKIHKPGMPLRPIVSSRDTVTYGTAKQLARILKPLVSMSQHNVLHTRDIMHLWTSIRTSACWSSAWITHILYFRTDTMSK